MGKFLFYSFITVLFTLMHQKTKDEWKTRIIYQILTDRFERTDAQITECKVEDKMYCGGTFKGITNSLDYITGMGFNAIWISPIYENSPNAFHGYHTINFYNINPHFGTEQDLIYMINECHKRDIWVMVDVIANHVAPVEISLVTPFNKQEYYHDYCEITPDDWKNNQERVENCRLAGLPDLRQENDFVRETLLEWIKYTINRFNFDGIRIDTVVEVPKWFWKQFSKSAGVFQVGETADGRIDYVCDYQNYLDSVLNFPQFYILINVFGQGETMKQIDENIRETNLKFVDPLALATFISNHDNSRFLSHTSNTNRLYTAIAFIMTTNGIPIFYYGDEQMFNGGPDPFNRESLFGHKDITSYGYKLVSLLVNLRKMEKLWEKKQIQVIAEDNLYGFVKGGVLILFTNTDEQLEREIHLGPEYEGITFCDWLIETECLEVNRGSFNISIKSQFKLLRIKQISFLE